MTEFTFPYTGERAVPWNPATGHIMLPHAARYTWALPFAMRRSVVDLACGLGYGTFWLSMVAKSVTGIDISADAIACADAWFRAPNAHYVVGDITRGLPPAEVYTAFECLEHLDKPGELVRRISGRLLWSLPVEDASRFHVRAYSVAEIEQLMAPSDLYYQDAGGLIVRKEIAWFAPVYVLGVRSCGY